MLALAYFGCISLPDQYQQAAGSQYGTSHLASFDVRNGPRWPCLCIARRAQRARTMLSEEEPAMRTRVALLLISAAAGCAVALVHGSMWALVLSVSGNAQLTAGAPVHLDLLGVLVLLITLGVCAALAIYLVPIQPCRQNLACGSDLSWCWSLRVRFDSPILSRVSTVRAVRDDSVHLRISRSRVVDGGSSSQANSMSRMFGRVTCPPACHACA